MNASCVSKRRSFYGKSWIFFLVTWTGEIGAVNTWRTIEVGVIDFWREMFIWNRWASNLVGRVRLSTITWRLLFLRCLHSF